MKEIEADLKHRHPDWEQRLAQWEADVYGNLPAWTVLRPDIDDISTGGQNTRCWRTVRCWPGDMPRPIWH